MMKLRNGNSVEVLRREHDPCGLWFPGNIISAVGSDYVVNYKFLMGNEGEPVLEKVRGVEIRPLPLHKTGNRWKVGDIAEVLDNQCWKVGEVAKVLQKNWFVIRLFGSLQLKEFHESNMRIRNSWHNNKWSAIGKVAPDRQFSTINNSNVREKDQHGCQEDRHGYSKMCLPVQTLKRCHADYCKTNSKNLLLAGSHKKRNTSPFIGEGNGFPLSKQIVDVSSQRLRPHDKYTEVSPDWDSISFTPLWSNEDGNQCSVASCSSNDLALFSEENVHNSVENESNSSDAESSIPALSGKKHIVPSLRNKLEVGIHGLELRAYKLTVQALYASGPLSWEQESLLTNLRLSLNISDEEHLLQLRHLLSAQVV